MNIFRLDRFHSFDLLLYTRTCSRNTERCKLFFEGHIKGVVETSKREIRKYQLYTTNEK